MSGHERLPRGLRRLLAARSDEDRRRKFRYAHGRESRDEDELDEFILGVARELYNADYDEWPDDEDEELARDQIARIICR